MAVYGGPEITTSGLVLYLDAANKKSYPGTGTTWNDLSPTLTSGTLSSVTFDSSNKGNLIFDATSDYIVINDSSIFNFNSTFSLSVWIKINTANLSTIYNILSKKASFNNTQKGWSCQLDYRNTGIIHFRNNDGTVAADSTQDSTVDNTTLLNQTSSYKNIVWVVTASPARVSFYIDGSLRSGPHGITYTNTDTNNNLYIGKTLGSASDPAPPISLAQICLYNRNLSASEISNNYKALKGRYGL